MGSIFVLLSKCLLSTPTAIGTMFDVVGSDRESPTTEESKIMNKTFVVLRQFYMGEQNTKMFFEYMGVHWKIFSRSRMDTRKVNTQSCYYIH